MLDCQKAVSGIPAMDFMSAIKNRPINNDSLVNFTEIPFTERQARLLYAKFQSDNPAVDTSKMSSPTLKNLFDTLPRSMRQAVQPDSVKNVDGLVAVDVIQQVSSSHGFTQMVDPAATQSFLPLEKRLLEKVKTYGFQKLADWQLINLMYSDLLTVEATKVIDIRICKIANPMSLTFRPPVVNAVYEICKTQLGPFCSGSIDRYGLLSVGATASDILAITDHDALFNYCIPDFCQMIRFANTAQIEALLTLVRAHLDSKKDLGNIFMKINCLLPYLGGKYLNQTTYYEDRLAMCELIACQVCINVPTQILREAMDFCIASGVSLKTFTCPSGRGRCLMETMNKGYASLHNITCGPAIVDAIDMLQATAMDCGHRADLYTCVKDHLSLTDKNSLSLLGSLVDQFSDADWNSVPTKNLCGLLSLVSKVWAAWDQYQTARTAWGLKPAALCTNRAAVLAKLRAAEASPDCTGTSDKRRKRDTTTLTCDQVNQMGYSVTELSASQLQTLSTTDFFNCAQFLGRVIGFKADQWTALATVAKQAYNTDCSKWTPEQITSAAGIVTGLSANEISALDLKDLNAIHAVGSNGLWSVDQLMKAFACVKKNYKNNNVTTFTSAELSSLSNIICGATGDEIKSLQAKEVCGAVEDIGQLHTCEDQQLLALADQEKACLGSDVTKWLPSDIKAIGSLIGGLTKADISVLTQAQIQAISVSSIPEIPPIQFSGFTSVQLEYFSTYQAAVITPAQYQSLDQTKQSVVQKKLSSVSDDVTLNPSSKQGGSGKSVCSPLSASLLPLVTAPLAFLLRI